MTDDAFARVLRWYPQGWRERYGDELVALMEDVAGGPPSRRLRASMAMAGLRERLHWSGLIGSGASRYDRVLSGSFVVLVAFSLFAVAGLQYAREAQDASPAFSGFGPFGVAGHSFDVVALLGLSTTALVGFGALVLVPAAARFWKTGAWRAIGGHLWRAGALVVLTTGAGFGVTAWAQHINSGMVGAALPYGDPGYAAAASALALLVAIAAVQVIVCVVAVVRRMNIGLRTLRLEATLAVAVTAGMIGATAAACAWWASAESLPQLQGWLLPVLGQTTPDWQVLATLGLMVLATLLALYGATRIVRAAPHRMAKLV